MEIITSHQRADFDAIAAILAAHKLFPDAVPLLPKPLGSSASEFITLYQEGLPFIPWDEFEPQEPITSVILVDTQTVPSVRGLAKAPKVTIIDHHTPDDELPPNAKFIGDMVGAATTLLVERIREANSIQLNSLEATLLMLGIYADTGALTYASTQPRDLLAASWLLQQQADLDTVRRFLTPSLDETQRHLLHELVRASETQVIEGYTVTVATLETEAYVEEVNNIVHHLGDALEPHALLVVIEMPQGSQLVCRSSVDAINVAEIARYFGGGGHPRAAAATISDLSLDKIETELWSLLRTVTKPVARVADLMSFGIQTVKEDQRLDEVINFLRRVGHEGYPVLDDRERVAGLLTRRDADRAIEHGLRRVRVRDVMMVGEVTLQPEDSVSTLEQRMVESGWGQIPVVKDSGEVIGIVTRTDLIQHWARTHPSSPVPLEYIDPGQLFRVMGDSAAGLIELIAEHGRRNHISLYLVGGVVRDLMLERRNFDIDFVIEGDAVRYAQDLAALYGGEATYFRPFGTAKWHLDPERIARVLNIKANHLPEFVDFATSRNEFYEHPTALPSVYNSSIKLDLQRRDFTINTLAVQLSPRGIEYRLLDFYGGMNDLRNGLIRVLHSLSFVDDPTRIIRAVRFEHRLGFQIETRTAELISSAKPMLRRITGQRLRDELNKLFQEDQPEAALLAMQERGILPAIHMAFHFHEETAADFQTARTSRSNWPLEAESLEDVYWHLIMLRIDPEGITELSERLMCSRSDTDSFLKLMSLVQPDSPLQQPDARPSQITRTLENTDPAALVALWVAGDAQIRSRIEHFVQSWQHVKPVTNGHTLTALGLKPGPNFSTILSRLRTARLDEEVTTDAEEKALLQQLIEEVVHDGA